MGYWFDYYFDRIKRNLPKRVFKRFAVSYNLGTVVGAVATQFETLETDNVEFEKSLNPMTAEGFWLDFWGFFLGETRFFQEDDDQFRGRIRNSIMYGKNSQQAIIEAIRPLCATTPQITESRGTILQNDNYSTFDYDAQYEGRAFVIVLQYRPKSTGSKALIVDESFIDNAYVYSATGESSNIQEVRIKDIVKRTKLAGIKVIHNIS